MFFLPSGRIRPVPCEVHACLDTLRLRPDNFAGKRNWTPKAPEGRATGSGESTRLSCQITKILQALRLDRRKRLWIENQAKRKEKCVYPLPRLAAIPSNPPCAAGMRRIRDRLQKPLRRPSRCSDGRARRRYRGFSRARFLP